MKKQFCLLFIITIFAFFLRTVQLSGNPPSLSWDEVSIGYNAYSILKTGKDEHGRFFPLDTFTAYGDYKPPLGIYLTVPSVAVFGLNEFAVRFPSALFGTLTILLTYFLVIELFRSDFNNSKFSKSNFQFSNKFQISNFKFQIALLSSLLLAISPWHINLSRAGFEANIALFFVVLGIIAVLKAIDRPKLWIAAWIPFVGAVYTFNSARYFVPLMAGGLLFMGRNAVKKHLRFFGAGVIIAVFFMIPIIPHLLSKEARLRFTEVNIFSDPEIVLVSNRRIEEARHAWWAKILFNRRVGYARSYMLHFLDHFQPEYLFIKGDGNPKFSIQDVGQLYLIEAPFVAIGVLSMLVQHRSIALFLLYWMIMAIAPAAVARETPHALRTLNSLPTWQIFTAYGILTTVLRIKMKLTRKVFLFAFCLLLASFYGFGVIYYLHNYYVHYPKEFSGEWQYGYKQALQFIQPIESNYDTIYMTGSIGRPYMYSLFYNKTDPHEFFRTKNASFDTAGFYHVYGFGKYHFTSDMPEDCTGTCLYIAPAGTETRDKKILHTVNVLNGNPILVIYE